MSLELDVVHQDLLELIQLGTDILELLKEISFSLEAK